MNDFTGQTVFISGATGGMGAAHVRAYYEHGANVIIAARDVDAAHKLAADLPGGLAADLPGRVAADLPGRLAAELPGRTMVVRLDVTGEASWQNAVAAAETRFGPISILVNNAGVQNPAAPIEHTDREVWDRVLDVNLTGSYLGIKTVVPSLRRGGGGSIVNVASTTAHGGTAFFGPYVASKWAIRGLTRTAALELARDDIRVNSIHPGVVATPLITEPNAPGEPPISDFYDPGPYAIPRLADPEELSRLLLFITSPAAAFATGSEFVLDGGLLLGPVPSPAL
ncbi:SDR family NAD(P)-dependent oxidoreductase [Actinoplanes solisilvae]|uniref:SDR family NAD(P)-dependent oxidoreductase n=1 Tax=Actinoplanes solisilvae TaxID=2486853 RepID=UPI000FD980D9|nr:SDR family oxidoreductase [Actinoplanes solisilvae]